MITENATGILKEGYQQEKSYYYILKKDRIIITERKTKQESEEMDEDIDMKCGAVWIRDTHHEKCE